MGNEVDEVFGVSHRKYNLGNRIRVVLLPIACSKSVINTGSLWFAPIL